MRMDLESKRMSSSPQNRVLRDGGSRGVTQNSLLYSLKAPKASLRLTAGCPYQARTSDAKEGCWATN